MRVIFAPIFSLDRAIVPIYNGWIMQTKIEQEKAKLKIALRRTAEQHVTREISARNGFFEMLNNRGYTFEQASKIWDLYISRKVLIVNHVAGGWSVKAGNLLDDDVLRLICDTSDVSVLKFGKPRRK